MIITENEMKQAGKSDPPKVKPRTYAAKGYVKDPMRRGRIKLRAYFHNKNIAYDLGTFDTEEDARAQHMTAVDNFNAGTFTEWYESLEGKKVS